MAITDQVTGANLGLEFEIGTNVPNKITIKTDGTSVVRDATTGSLGSPGPVYDNVAKTLTFPDVNGVAQPVIDLSALAADIFVNGGTLVADVLTLTDNDAGTPDIVVDLSALKGASTDAGNLLVNGSDGKPLLNEATIEALASEVVCDVFGVPLFNAFPL